MLISVIIPIYNTPLEIFERCLQSIYKNKCDFEVIVVDDGSASDLSIQYQKCLSQYIKTKYLYHRNKGVSYSRNQGIIASSGKYIVFVDADDILLNNFLDIVTSEVNNNDVDILVGCIEAGVSIGAQRIPREYIFDGNTVEAEKGLLVGNLNVTEYAFLGSPCGRAYKKDALNGLLFKENVDYFEDQLFNITAFHQAKSILALPTKVYYYFQNDFSAMHKGLNINYLKKMFPFLNELYLLIDNVIYEDIKEELGIFSIRFIFEGLRNLNGHSLTRLEKKETINDLKRIPLYTYLEKSFKLRKYKNLKIAIQLGLIKTGLISVYMYYIKIKHFLKKL